MSETMEIENGFHRYQHVCRMGTVETEGILNGNVYVFPKIDGTNSQIWYNGQHLHCGSRNKELESEKADSTGFCRFLYHPDNHAKFTRFFESHPNWRLYGEFLIPHSIRNYKKDAWTKFYVFDVVETVEGIPTYIPYENYKIELEKFEIDYIPLVAKLESPDQSEIEKLLEVDKFLLEEGTFGEGLVIKNYEYRNPYGRITWGKIIHKEFNNRPIKKRVVGEQIPVEEAIVEKYLTESFIRKEYEKIFVDEKLDDRVGIPKLLNIAFSELLSEEINNIVKHFKRPTINFALLNKLCVAKIKETMNL